MTSRPMRSLAVLAMLCLVSRLSALTIVQTGSFTYGAVSLSGATAVASVPWTIQGFDPLVGELTSVTLNAHIDSSASNSVNNFLPVPVSFSRQLRVESIYNIQGGSLGSVATTQNMGDMLLQPGQTSSFSSTFSQDLNVAFSTDAQLAPFIGSGSKLMSVGGRSDNLSPTGNPAFNSTANATVTYTFRIPDGGITAFLLGTSVAALFMLRRRERE